MRRGTRGLSSGWTRGLSGAWTPGSSGAWCAAVIGAQHAAARAARGLHHVRKDRVLGARGDDRHREPGDVDVCAPSGTPPVLDRQHSHDVIRSHEPPVAKRHHADVCNSHNFVFAHRQIIANTCSLLLQTTARSRMSGRSPAHSFKRPNGGRRSAAQRLRSPTWSGRGSASFPGRKSQATWVLDSVAARVARSARRWYSVSPAAGYRPKRSG